MTSETLRRVVFLHGLSAWLGALLLVIVTGLLLRGKTQDKPWFRAVALLATANTIGAFLTGVFLDEHYRIHLRQKMFLASRALGWLFERKMHLSFGAFVFACIGLLTLVAMYRDNRFVRASRAAYLAASIFALSACVISSIVRA
jgi:hypothetical protein